MEVAMKTKVFILAMVLILSGITFAQPSSVYVVTNFAGGWIVLNRCTASPVLRFIVATKEKLTINDIWIGFANDTLGFLTRPTFVRRITNGYVCAVDFKTARWRNRDCPDPNEARTNWRFSFMIPMLMGRSNLPSTPAQTR